MVDASLPVGSLLSYIAALSVATERVTEFIKRIPGISRIFSNPQPKGSAREDLRVMGVHLLAALVAMTICHCLKKELPWSLCFGYGVLASGGSGFWNGALDALRSVKKTMGG